MSLGQILLRGVAFSFGVELGMCLSLFHHTEGQNFYMATAFRNLLNKGVDIAVATRIYLADNNLLHPQMRA